VPADGAAAAPGHRGADAGRAGRCLSSAPAVLAFILAMVLVWSALPALLQSVPHADNIEQLNWAHALQWGYIKHPPLPTWLLYGSIALVGPSAFLTYFLAMACVGATLLLLWCCARTLLDREAAALVVLLSSADYYLMGRGSFLNHNTVMLPFVAASAWAVLRIVQGAGWRAWGVLGLVQALGLLTKYQMAIVIAANALALLGGGAWRRPRFAAHVALAAAATLVPLLPHLLWLQAHAFSTFTYAGHSLLADLPPADRAAQALGFLAQQLGRFAPAVVALGLALGLQRAVPALAPAASTAPAPLPAFRDVVPERVLALLALTPVGLIVLLALFAGVAPQNHWGASSTLLLPLLVVVLLRPARRPCVAAALTAVLAVQAAAVAWNVVAARRAPGFHHAFAAEPLAAMALEYWQGHTGGRIEVVIGPDWDAGAIALELPSHPSVLASGDRGQAPWVSDALLARCGALVLWRTGQDPASQIGADFAARLQFPVHLHTTVPHGKVSQIEAGILAPEAQGCPP